MGSPVAIQTRFGTLFAGLRTNRTARGKHARVETGRNMPGTTGKCLSTLHYATSCRTITAQAHGEAVRWSTTCEYRKSV